MKAGNRSGSVSGTCGADDGIVNWGVGHWWVVMEGVNPFGPGVSQVGGASGSKRMVVLRRRSEV